MESQFMKLGEDVLAVDRGLKNKWRWAWASEKGRSRNPFGSWCQKLREPGACFCIVCSRKLFYATSGKKALARHELDPGHVKAFRKLRRETKSPAMKKRKRSRSRSPSPKNASHQVRKFSRSEVQKMIQHEVFHAVKHIEAKIEDVLGKVKQLECEPQYDVGIRQLEAQVKKLNRRGDAVWASIQKYGIGGTQDKTEKREQLINPVISVKVLDIHRPESDEETKEALSNNRKTTDLDNDWLQIKKEPSSPLPVSPALSSSLQHTTLDVTLKEELTFPGNFTDNSTTEIMGELKVEPHEDDSPAESAEMETVFPPLPIAPFPSTLNAEAALYNIPQKPTLQLAVIKKPPGLSVLWNMEQEDPAAAPLDSFSIFMTIETLKGSSVFMEWKTLGEFQACPLPMCVMLSKYKPGYHVGFTVVAKDKFGRYGPFSNVVPARIPENI